MLRERREADLDVLCTLLEASLADPHGWLCGTDADRSWVFDQAPVSVAPTRHVVGHVQSYRPSDTDWTHAVSALLSCRVDDVLVVGRLFVAPIPHAFGVARYLLTEARSHVARRSLVPVLDPADVRFVPPLLVARSGFREAATGDGLRAVLLPA